MMLLLIRHGMTPITGVRLAPRPPGQHLSERGHEQARDLASRMGNLSLDAIYCSSLHRALETAKPLATSKKLRIRVRDGLEDTHYGEWEGRALKQLAATKQWRRVLAHPSEGRFPGGETLAETQARVMAVVRSIVDAHPRGTVAVVSHADPIRLVLAHYAGIHIDGFQRLNVAPASVSALWVGEGGPRVLKMNDTGSLDDLVRTKR